MSKKDGMWKWFFKWIVAGLGFSLAFVAVVVVAAIISDYEKPRYKIPATDFTHIADSYIAPGFEDLTISVMIVNDSCPPFSSMHVEADLFIGDLFVTTLTGLTLKANIDTAHVQLSRYNIDREAITDSITWKITSIEIDVDKDIYKKYSKESKK